MHYIPDISRPNITRYWTQYCSDFELSKDTPDLALTGELCMWRLFHVLWGKDTVRYQECTWHPIDNMRSSLVGSNVCLYVASVIVVLCATSCYIGLCYSEMWQYVWPHYSDVTMGAMASQIASLTIVYSIVYSVENQRKHQSSASLAFVRGIHRGPVNSPHKWPVTRKMFPFHDVIMKFHI